MKGNERAGMTNRMEPTVASVSSGRERFSYVSGGETRKREGVANLRILSLSLSLSQKLFLGEMVQKDRQTHTQHSMNPFSFTPADRIGARIRITQDYRQHLSSLTVTQTGP